MKRNLFALSIVIWFALPLRADPPRVLHASFPDGTGIEIFTETTGSSHIDFEGGMGIGQDQSSQDVVNRVVTDRANNILFAYNLEASRGAAPNTVMIRIKPINAATEAELLNRKDSSKKPSPGTHLPTVSGVREFAAVKFGEVVTLDILYDPSTGEKIFDVLRPITAATSGMSVTAVPRQETISLKDIAIRVNGRAISAPASLMIGAAVRIDIPRHGTYLVAAYDPHKTVPDHAFAAIANADGKKLSWAMGEDRVEITSSTSVLTLAGKGVLWVYHDAHYQPDVVGLQSAETVDWLLPKR